MRAPFAQQTFAGLTLTLLMTGLTAQAQDLPGTPLGFSEPVSTTSDAATAASSQSIVLARPLEDSVPNFLNDLDNYLMSDELINDLEGRYALQLREFSMKQGFTLNSRDSRLTRNYVGRPAGGILTEENEVRNEIARSMKKYMLARGLPRFLSSKKQTRFIGDSYTEAVAMAQNIGRVELTSKDESWKFSSGVNPLTTKTWIKVSNPANSLEAYNFFDQKDSIAIVYSYRYGHYTPWTQYFVQRKSVDSGVKYRINSSFESELRTSLPLVGGPKINNVVTSIASTYRF